MRRWDSLADAHIKEYEARGLTGSYVETSRRELERWGNWLKRRRPKPRLEAISADLHVRYIQERTAFRAKATVYGVLSKMRCFGDFLIAQSVWTENPLKWMQGPKLTPYHRMPKRIDGKDMKALCVDLHRKLSQKWNEPLWLDHLPLRRSLKSLLFVLRGTGNFQVAKAGSIQRANQQ